MKPAPLDGISYLRVGPTKVRVRTVGEGPPLLLIMGIGGNLRMWEPLVEQLPGRLLIMFDFPGTGRSQLSWLPPTMGNNALFVRLLIRKLGFQRIDVLGYSWGGILAQHLAIQHPNVVRRLILVCTTVGLGGRPGGPRTLVRMMTPRRYYSAPYFTKIAPTLYGGRYRRENAMVEGEIKRRTSRPPSLIGYTAQMTALVGYSTLPFLRLLSAPTLVLAGDDDPIVPTSNATLIAARVPNATVRILPDEGHLVMMDSPKIVAPLIEEFLNR
ncbi:MAG: alpha/beta fold hydrolase [Pseudonocardiales bacterium]|nr:alpha/beta fold hydrolase [Pseudonocardiales bacterium]